MKRPSRLQAAKHWIPTYTGKSIIKGYKKWFAVDVVCAIKELQILGVKLDDQKISQMLRDSVQRTAARKKLEEKKKQALEYCEDSDDDFYFIAGYTSGGVPYETTWEEAALDFGEDILSLKRGLWGDSL